MACWWCQYINGRTAAGHGGGCGGGGGSGVLVVVAMVRRWWWWSLTHSLTHSRIVISGDQFVVQAVDREVAHRVEVGA